MTYFPALCYLGFGELILTSANSRRHPSFYFPASLWGIRRAAWCLLPNPAPRMLSAAPEFTMPRGAPGEVCEEPTAPQAAVDTGTAQVLLNTTSQSHLSHCVKPSSIHPPDKTHSPHLPHPIRLQAPEVLNLFPPPTPAGAAPLKAPLKWLLFLFIFIFFLFILFSLGVKGSAEALHLHGHFEQRLLCSDCNHHRQIQ